MILLFVVVCLFVCLSGSPELFYEQALSLSIVPLLALTPYYLENYLIVSRTIYGLHLCLAFYCKVWLFYKILDYSQY